MEKIFDSTINNNNNNNDNACVFVANSLIPGLQQGINKMTRNSIYEFYIPSHLAYGEYGSKFIR